MAAQCRGVAKDDKLHPCPRHGHVHAAQVTQKTDLAFVVRTDQADEHHIALLSLETVDRVDCHHPSERPEFLVVAEKAAQELYLGAIGRNDAKIDAFVHHAVRADAPDIITEHLQG